MLFLPSSNLTKANATTKNVEKLSTFFHDKTAG
jgi:hypothetical protein